MRTSYTYKDAVRIITAAAKDYKRLLENNNFLFIYKDRETNTIKYFETVFLARNFQHLTGIDYIFPETGKKRKNSVDFYKRCISNNISAKEIAFREDGTTQLKLKALPRLVHFLQFSKMTVTYNGNRPRLKVDRFAGTANYCLGFTMDGNYYIPSSCLLEDIRDLGNNPSQILAVLQRSVHAEDRQYGNIRYTARGIDLNQLICPEDLKEIVDFKNFKKI